VTGLRLRPLPPCADPSFPVLHDYFEMVYGPLIGPASTLLARALNRHLAGRLIVSQEAERHRIARELHDDVSQKIALLMMNLDRLAGRSGIDREQFKEVSDRAGEIASDIHQLSHELHPSKLHALGLVPAMKSLCRDFSQAHRIQVSSLDAACRIVGAGLGIAVLPREATAPHVSSSGLAMVPLAEPWAVRRFVICSRADSALSATARLLIDHLRAQAKHGPTP